MAEEKKDIILIIEGGGMLGVFGAGVVTALQEARIYNRLHSVYGWSAGAHDTAYFLANQSWLASSIYYLDLDDRKFIKKWNLIPWFWELILYRLFKKSVKHQVMNLDYLYWVETVKKKMDLDTLVGHNIPFFVAVYDLAKRQSVFLDGRQNTMTLIKASASSPPFYATSVTVGGREYIDVDVNIGGKVTEIIDEHPDKKIIYVINNTKTIYSVLLAFPFEILRYIMMSLRFGTSVSWEYLWHTFRFTRPAEKAKLPNVLLAANRHHYFNFVTKRAKLLRVYHDGLAQGKELVRLLGYPLL